MSTLAFDQDSGNHYDLPRRPRRTAQYRLGGSENTLRIAFLLALAGYDPACIPVAKRLAALHVAWCLQQDLDEEDIAEHVRRPLRHVRTSLRLLREAARNDLSLRPGKFPFCTP